MRKQARNSCRTRGAECRSQESNSCEGQAPGLFSSHSSSPRRPQCSIPPGAKAVRTGYKILLYPQRTCSYSSSNRTQHQVWLFLFSLPSLLCRKNMFNYPGDAQIHSQCEISKQHGSLHSRKENSRWLPPWPLIPLPLLALALPLLTVWLVSSRLLLCIYICICTYTTMHGAMFLR